MFASTIESSKKSRFNMSLHVVFEAALRSLSHRLWRRASVFWRELAGLGSVIDCGRSFTIATIKEHVQAMQATVSTLLLRNVPLFSMLPEDQLTVLTKVVRRNSFLRGATIIAAGDVTDSLYVVISGRFKVIIGDKTGREIILAVLGPGEYFGEMVPIEDNTRSASVVAMEPGDLLVLSKNEFRKCLQDNFEMAMTMLRCAVQRLREADRKIGRLALMDVYSRVAGHLLEMSETIDGQHVIAQKIVKQQMADTVGASREMVSKVMKDLQAGGFIEVRGKAIYLRDSIATID
jgi:CRP/FNR family cyclic AMP-dependent transcriptional regulator